jgi:hypothetical protein
MRLSGFGRIRSVNSLLGLCLCLVLIGLITAGAIAYIAPSSTGGMLPDVRVCQAEPLVPNNVDYTPAAIGGDGPVIQLFKADPMELDAADSAAVYTFKVKRATNVVINEAGNNIKNISNPSGAALNGTADGLPASAITTDASGKFISTITASNEYGSDTAELTLSLAADLIPAGQSGPTDNRTEQRTPQWGPLIRAPLTSTPSNIINDEPKFFKCPSDCDHCLKPDEAASTGYTQRCSEELCYYSPDKQQKWYCYKPTPGWCCANGKVSQSIKSECDRMQGFWSTSQADAIDACQPKGFCCLNGQVYYPSTEVECARMGGSNWSTNQAQVMERCQPPCYCCLNGQVYQTSQAQCTQAGGFCYNSLAEAQGRCQPPCWCCLKGEVFQTTQDRCAGSGGGCYATQSQAAAACRGQGETFPPTYLR